MTDIQRDDISLKALLDFCLKNWIALTVIPAIIAVVAFVAASNLPRTYTTTARLAPPTTGAELTSSLYLAVASVRSPVSATVADNTINLTATSQDKAGAEQAVRAATASLLASLEDAMADERARLNRQRVLLDQIWQEIDGTPQAVLGASSMEGTLTERADRLALVERWLTGSRNTSAIASSHSPAPLIIAIVALIATLSLSAAYCALQATRSS